MVVPISGVLRRHRLQTEIIYYPFKEPEMGLILLNQFQHQLARERLDSLVNSWPFGYYRNSYRMIQ